MSGFKAFSVTEQVAQHLKEELLRGRWVGLMPGEDRLMAHLSIGRVTVREALNLLEVDGWIENQGAGRQRKITLPDNPPSPSLRVGILLYDPPDRESYRVNLLRQRLLDAGHIASIASKTLESLGMNPDRVSRYVKSQPYDAWIVCAAPKQILDWFSKQSTPAFAMFGSLIDFPIAGAYTDKRYEMLDLIQELIDMGHRRIVNISRKERLVPKRSIFESMFIEKLHDNGISTSEFNLPIWGPDPADLHRCLERIFAYTPPTVIMVDEHMILNAIQHHLSNRGIISPRDVSLICGEANSCYSWMEEEVTHIEWDEDRIVQAAIRWISNVARGKKDIRQTKVSTKLVRGGTIGPPRKG